jgi:microtubule-associated protein-like 6
VITLQITLPQRDTQFSTYTVALGFPVMGIFPPYADGTEVNAVDRSKDGKVRGKGEESML